MTIDIALYLLTGCFAGLAAGMFGVGGGLIIVPVLFFIFTAQGIAPEHLMHMALATSLATIIITSISSTLAHNKKRAVLWPVFLTLAPGICIGAWLGGTVASLLPTEILKPVFGIFEIFIAYHLLSKKIPEQHTAKINRIKSTVAGALIGIVSAIIGIGGGTLTVPFLHWHNIPLKNAVATSSACGLPIAVFGTTAFIISGWNATSLPENSFGYVYLPAFAFIMLASFAFAPVGAKLAHALPEKTLKRSFALLLLVISLEMIF